MNQTKFQVLLVEDDMTMPDMIYGLLEEVGIVLSHARRGSEALTLIHAHPTDLVLLDLGLPDMSGFELLSQLKSDSSTQTIPVIALTAANQISDKLRAFELGASDYITKPFDGTEFRGRVRAVLRAKFLSDELIQANRRLTAARMAAESTARAKSDFLAAMSHEIRTPMNGVIAMVSLLLETPLTAEQRGYLETIHGSSEALLTIINDILDFSKIEAGKLELHSHSFLLRACVEDTLDLMAARAFEKNLDLVCAVDDAIPDMVEGDALRLRQVLANLLSNAIKFTKDGDISVQVKLISTKTEGATERSLLHLHFSVSDTGMGISPDKLARLFKPFMQGDASTAKTFGGTGLGLAIGKQLVELMGGKIWAESMPGEGATFHFTMNVQAEANVAPFALAGRQGKLADLRVLIVDDNAASRRMLAALTAGWGMIPQTAENAREALDHLRDNHEFDLAILDAQMPGVDGFTLAAEIHQLSHSAMMPLVLLVPMGVRLDAPPTARIPFISYTGKPVKLGPFFETLTHVFSNVKPPAKITPPPRADPGLASRRPLKILLCDDNAINQKVATRIVQQLGYKPDLAGNGYEALDALDKTAYDFIFMDVMMPEMDGLEATRAIRERQKEGSHLNYKSRIVVVAMTAQAMQGDREKCLAAGMDDYLSKPIRPKDLRDMIEKWTSETAAPGSKQSGSGPDVVDAAAEAPPVEMERLTDLADGNVEIVRELLDLYYKQTTQQFAQIEAAVRENKTEEVRHLAHSCKGASATMGMARLAGVLFELEKQGKSGALVNAGELCADAAREFKRVQDFLAAQPALTSAPTIVHS